MNLPKLWNKPGEEDGYPETPGLDGEGLPVVAGYDPVAAFWDGTGPREWQELTKWRYEAGGEVAGLLAAEAGRANLAARWFYNAQRKLRGLGQLAWPTLAGKELIRPEGKDSTNYDQVWPFSATTIGDGTTIAITWAGWGYDGRSLERIKSIEEEMQNVSLQPGMWVMDNRAGAYGIAQILDGEYTAGGVTLYLNKPLRPSEHGGTVWIFRPTWWPVTRMFHPFLDGDIEVKNRRCRHGVEVAHRFLSSFAALYPEHPYSKGVSEGWYCSKMGRGNLERGDPDLNGFTGPCYNKTCLWYEEFLTYETHPKWDAVNAFYSGGGQFREQSKLGEPEFMIGDDGLPGLLTLIGFRRGVPFGWYMLYKVYLAIGAIRNYVGLYSSGTPNAGEPCLADWLWWQEAYLENELHQANRDDVHYNEDCVPLFTRLLGAVDFHGDPSGGANPSENSLQEGAPGYEFERRMPMRVGSGVLDYSRGEAGPGIAETQRAQRRRTTSRVFQTGVDSDAATNRHSRVRTYAEKRPLLAGGEAFYDVMLEVSRWGEDIQRPIIDIFVRPLGPFGPYCPGRYKDIPITETRIVSIVGETLVVDFALGEMAFYYATEGDLLSVNYVDAGGNVVCPPNSWVPRNPGTATQFGDRQRLLTPGDAVYFWDPALWDHPLIVLSATAFGGEEWVDGRDILINYWETPPAPFATGLPKSFQENFSRMDRVVFSLEGVGGEAFKAFHAAGKFDVPVYMLIGGHYAVAPSVARGYMRTAEWPENEGSLMWSDGETVQVIDPRVSPCPYVWDAATGKFYVDSAAAKIPSGRPVRLFVDGWVNNIQEHFVCETAEIADRHMNEVIPNCVIREGFGGESGYLTLSRRATEGGDVEERIGFFLRAGGGDLWENPVPFDGGLDDGVDPNFYEEAWKYVSAGGVPGLEGGGEMSAEVFFMPGGEPRSEAVLVTSRQPCLLLSDCCKWWPSDAVGQARVWYKIECSVFTTRWREYGSDDDWETNHLTGITTKNGVVVPTPDLMKSFPKLGIGLYNVRKNEDETVTVERRLGGGELSLAKFTDPYGNPFLAGMGTSTQLVKDVIDNPRDTDCYPAFLLEGPYTGTPGSDLAAEGVLRTWLDYYNIQWVGEHTPSEPYGRRIREFRQSRVVCNSMDVGYLLVTPSIEGLERTCAEHWDADGVCDAPDLAAV